MKFWLIMILKMLPSGWNFCYVVAKINNSTFFFLQRVPFFVWKFRLTINKIIKWFHYISQLQNQVSESIKVFSAFSIWYAWNYVLSSLCDIEVTVSLTSKAFCYSSCYKVKGGPVTFEFLCPARTYKLYVFW